MDDDKAKAASSLGNIEQQIAELRSAVSGKTKLAPGDREYVRAGISSLRSSLQALGSGPRFDDPDIARRLASAGSGILAAMSSYSGDSPQAIERALVSASFEVSDWAHKFSRLDG
ncbi:hypothetical protein SAMN04489708_11044 [Paracidovorax cattleyae]|uniref:Uncharacterized protein n=1 Tax=Paracidovorax cattleyae TaxID=80868 RepID=A0A1H0RFQ8_9BURK|nr:hypothetical protein SAMN04489708_11044 [Paracidovorax cattleyae]